MKKRKREREREEKGEEEMAMGKVYFILLAFVSCYEGIRGDEAGGLQIAEERASAVNAPSRWRFD